ncbi:MAG: hypothetical protein COB56_00110 [Robiginitomaculum sp.]|nr:MAG: hypothetical protein COB56_00110 [Robiginitomaculum sp.]
MDGINMSDEKKNGSFVRVEMNRHINAPVHKVFPLACPVMEYKWIPGWKCELIHCPNGHVELGTIFKEISSSPILADSIAERTTWTAVLYEPDSYRVHYRLDNRISSSLYKLEFEESISGGTNMRLEMAYTSLDGMGGYEVKKWREAKLKLMLSILSLMLTHYCEHGEIIETSEVKKLVLQVNELTFKDRIRLLLNKLVKRFMKDEDRIKFLRIERL